MNIHIYRSYLPFGTFGELWTDDGFHCFTVERPWLDNKPFESCIPEGAYLANRITYSTKTRGMDTFELQDVPDRTSIQIHHGNFPRNYQGCIGIGQSPLVIGGELGCPQSFDTFKSFILSLSGIVQINVVITVKTIN